MERIDDPAMKEILEGLIDVDCQGYGAIKTGRGKFCVIGGLWALIDPDGADSGSIGTANAIQRVHLATGLRVAFLDELVGTNDSYKTVIARRKHLQILVNQRFA